MNRHDVIVAGAGIVGLSAAWQIARRSPLRVLVLDKAPGLGAGSTGASSAICRYRYSLDSMVRLAGDGIAAYRHWRAFTGLAAPRARLHEDGVLWMPGTDATWSQTEHARLQSLGVSTQVLDADALAERFPALNPCPLAPDFETGEPHSCAQQGQYLLECDGGWVDPMDAAQDLFDACRAAGVEVRFGAAVSDIEQAGGAVQGVRLARGERLAAPLVLNATGPWCRTLNAAAGLPTVWDLAPVRIQVLYRDRPDSVPGHLPVTADIAAGIYFRTQNRGQQLVIGSVLEEDEREVVADPDVFAALPDDEFQMLKLHALHHRLPGLPYRGAVRGHCGLYTMNRDDVHPVVGPTPLEGFWVANGFSGHGFKLAPAIGSMLAQAITGERCDGDTKVPMAFLAYDRKPIDLANRSVLA